MEFAGLRVGLVGPLPPPAGGMANQTRQLAELLRGEKASVLVVQSNAPYRPALVRSIPFVRAAFRLIPFVWALWRTAGRSDVFHVMANSGWSWHLFAAPSIWIARARGVPVVVNYRGGEAANFLTRSHKLVRWSMKRSDRLAVPSGFLQDVFRVYGMPADIVPNIVDLMRFRPRGPRAAGSAHLIVARNLEPIYDNAMALRAFRLVLDHKPAATLTIAGSGPQEVWLRALASKLALLSRVCFAGALDRDAMASLYRQADVVLNPSLVDNMPNCVLEAMASGVPVVSTDVGGVPFLVKDGETALLVPPGDASRMADAVLRLLDAPDLWASLSTAGIAEAQRYAWPQVACELSRVYGQAIAGRSTSD